MNLIRTVARKEIREMVRDGRLRVLGVLVLLLALTALAFGARQTERAQDERQQAQERATTQWQNQGKKNPHVAGHFGTYLFAPESVATAIDPGVSAYMGRSIKIEAHRRNLAGHSQARDAGQQMGGFSVASIFLQLVPLLIIALGYGAWSRERERGTLRQLLSTGIERRVLLWGKSLALAAVVAAVLLPAALLITGVLYAMSGGGTDVLVRLGLLGVGYGVYFAIFGALTLFASAVCSSSRQALVVMVGLWGLFCLVVPRFGAEVASAVRPLPSQAQLARDIGQSLKKGIDGKADRETAVDAMVKDLLAKDGFADAGFMVDPAAERTAELKAETKWEDMVFDHHIGDLNDAIAAQENWVQVAGTLSPFVAMRSLSSGLCGTDFAHHRHFSDRAEAWRKTFIDFLDRSFAELSGDEGWSYKAGPELWKKAPPFVYRQPGLALVLRTHRLSLAVLGCWFLFSLGLALWASRRVRVV